MVKSLSVATLATAIVALALSSSQVDAAAMPTGVWPASKGLVQLVAPQVVKAGTTFDGGMKTYELKNVKCQGQKESSKNTMVFLVEPGATLKNVIIGKNQMERVHCEKHGCTIENVWWTDVCEDALSIKGGSASSVSKVIGGGARYADDKVVQHNGPGAVSIDGFLRRTLASSNRSCGTWGQLRGIVTVNKNFGDEAKLTNVKVKSSKSKVKVCAWSQGVAKGQGEPKELGDGPSGTLCQYSTSSVKITK
ncbi:Pectate lyase, partial [Globisporangium splendens]